MPNWCQNVIYVSHEDEKKMMALKDAIMNNDLCDHIIPYPKVFEGIHCGSCTIDGEQHSVWRTDAPEGATFLERMDANSIAIPQEEQVALRVRYGTVDPSVWTRNNWGTKWDISDVHEAGMKNDKYVFKFDTAWSPPIPVYEEMERQGFEILARYVEYGAGYFGHYSDGNDICGELTDDMMVRDEHLQEQYA